MINKFLYYNSPAMLINVCKSVLLKNLFRNTFHTIVYEGEICGPKIHNPNALKDPSFLFLLQGEKIGNHTIFCSF